MQTRSATGLRRLYLDGGTFERLLSFENRRRIFPIHSMFRFTALVYQRGRANGARDLRFGLTLPDQARDSSADLHIPRTFLASVSPTLYAIPEIRTPEERSLLLKLHRAHPRLGEQADQWVVSFKRELDMTNHSDLFVDAGDAHAFEPSALVPLLEGRSVHQHDYAAKGYECGQGRRARWRPMPLGCKRIQPHFYVRQRDVQARDVGHDQVRAGFCDITGHANERTALSALIPANVVCGNKVPTCRFQPNDPRLNLLWVAVANSFVVDWVIRRLVSTTINFFHWEQVPFPRLSTDDPVAVQLVELAAQLADLDGSLDAWLTRVMSRPVKAARDPRVRAVLRARIDAHVASLYSVSLREMAAVLADFPLTDRGQPPLPGEGASTVTRDLVLLHCARELREDLGEIDVMQLPGYREIVGSRCSTPSLPERVAKAAEIGAVAYVPGEGALAGY